MARRKEYDRVIITDKDGKPMAWAGDQLCYCTDEFWQDPHNPVRSYLPFIAKRHITNTIKFRTANKMEPGKYKTMPFSG